MVKTWLELTGFTGAWSANGSLHAFYKITSETNRDIWILLPDATAESFVATTYTSVRHTPHQMASKLPTFRMNLGGSLLAPPMLDDSRERGCR